MRHIQKGLKKSVRRDIQGGFGKAIQLVAIILMMFSQVSCELNFFGQYHPTEKNKTSQVMRF